MTIFLNHYLNARVNHKCVYRLMRLLELKAVIRRKRYTYKPHKPQHLAENILNRAFQEKYKKMEVLLTDITEFNMELIRKLTLVLSWIMVKIRLSHINYR